MRAALEEKLAARTRRRGPDQCWRWTSRTNEAGYGKIVFNGADRFAHRVAWELANNASADGLVIRHLCNHVWCVNPRHLRAGTHADNRRDTVYAGRQAKGSGNGRAKLTEPVVRELIRRMRHGERKTDLAAEFGVSRRALRLIETGRNWACVHARPTQVAIGSVSP